METAVPTNRRIARIRFVALAHDPINKNFQEISSVTAQVISESTLTSLTETVCAVTQRNVALWQDSLVWKQEGKAWIQIDSNDFRFHLQDVFTAAQTFCKTGVCHYHSRFLIFEFAMAGPNQL